jgi:hypothetical protein
LKLDLPAKKKRHSRERRFFIVFSVAAAAVSAGVFPAVMALTVVVVIAAEILPEFQGVVQKRLGDLTDVAFGAADHQNKGDFKGVDGSAADTAANKHIHLFLSQKRRKGAVSGIPCGQELFTDDLAVFSFKDGKTGGVSEVLKHLMIFTGHCDFHFILLKKS